MFDLCSTVGPSLFLSSSSIFILPVWLCIDIVHCWLCFLCCSQCHLHLLSFGLSLFFLFLMCDVTCQMIAINYIHCPSFTPLVKWTAVVVVHLSSDLSLNLTFKLVFLILLLKLKPAIRCTFQVVALIRRWSTEQHYQKWLLQLAYTALYFDGCNIFLAYVLTESVSLPLLYYFSDQKRFSRLICICTFAFTLANTHFNHHHHRCCCSLTSRKWLLSVHCSVLLIVLAASLTATTSLHPLLLLLSPLPHIHIFCLPTALHINSSQTHAATGQDSQSASNCPWFDRAAMWLNCFQ